MLHTFDNLTFDGDFDSGNVDRVEQRGTSDFVLHTRSDVAGVPNKGTWFYFAVRHCSDLPKSSKCATPWMGRVLQFEVRNMNPQEDKRLLDKLYWARDGIHPNNKGYTVWGEHIAQGIVVQGLLGAPLLTSAKA